MVLRYVRRYSSVLGSRSINGQARGGGRRGNEEPKQGRAFRSSFSVSVPTSLTSSRSTRSCFFFSNQSRYSPSTRSYPYFQASRPSTSRPSTLHISRTFFDTIITVERSTKIGPLQSYNEYRLRRRPVRRATDTLRRDYITRTRRLSGTRQERTFVESHGFVDARAREKPWR